MLYLKIALQVVLLSLALVAATLDYGDAERGTQLFQFRRTLLVVLVAVAGAGTVIVEVLTFRRELREDALADEERRANVQRIQKLQDAMAAERVAHQRENEQALAALDQIQVRFAEMQSHINTAELREELGRYQRELREAREVLAPGPRAVLFAAVSDPGSIDRIIEKPEVRPENNVASVRLWIYNTSGAPANTGTIWFKLHTPAEPVAMPSQLDYIDGAPRGEVTGRFNHIAASERTGPFDFKFRVSPEADEVTIAFRYSCQTCEVEPGWRPITFSVVR